MIAVMSIMSVLSLISKMYVVPKIGLLSLTRRGEDYLLSNVRFKDHSKLTMVQNKTVSQSY
jgi:hypothetical protein